MLYKEIIKSGLDTGVSAFRHGAKVVGEDRDLFLDTVVGGLIPKDGIEAVDIAATLFVIETGDDIPVVVVVDFDLDLVEDTVACAHVFDRKTVCRRAFGNDRYARNVVVAAAAQIFGKD